LVFFAIIGSAAIVILPLPALLISAIVLTILIGTLIEPGIGLIAALIAGPWAAWMNTYYPGLLPIDAGQILIASTLGAWLLRGLRHRAFTLPRSPILIPLILFAGWAAASMLWAPDLSFGLPEVLKWIEVILIMLFTIDLVQRRGLNWVLIAIMFTGLLQALIGIYEARVRGTGPLSFQLSAGVYRAYGTFEQPNPFAGFIGLVLPIAVALTTWYVVRGAWQLLRRNTYHSSPPLRYATGAIVVTRHSSHLTHYSLLVSYSIISLILIAALYLSFSRGAWLAAVAAIGAMIAFAPRRWWIGLGLVAASIGLLIGLSNSGLLPEAINQRLADAGELFQFHDVRGVLINDVNYALIERQAHWQAALNMLSDQPWTGVGFSNYQVVYDQYHLMNWPMALGHAHNIYLNVAAELGLTGLAAYLILWLSIFMVTFKTIRRASGLDRVLAIGLIGAWVYLSVHMLVDNLYVNNTHLIIGTLFGLLAAVYSRSMHDATRSSNQSTSNIQFSISQS
jgi:O-antigen ligase